MQGDTGKQKMKDLVLRVIADLAEKHNPEFIILYGSVARGDFNEESDIDVACFCTSPAVSKDVRMFNGRKLDCWIYSIEQTNPISNAYLRFIGGKLYLDEEGIGKAFLENIRIKYDAGPDAVTTDSINHLVEWSKHMLERSAGFGIEANYRRASLPCELLEIYFKLRNIWYMGPKNSFKWLKENDSVAYLCFEKTFHDPKDMEALAELVDATIDLKKLDVPI